MSLDFNYKAVDKRFSTFIAPSDRPGDYKKGDVLQHPVMNAVIWRLMAIGMTSITEQNYEQCHARSRFYEQLHPDVKMTVPQPLPLDGFEQRFLTKDDFFHLIGLKTNVSYEPQKKWQDRVVLQWMTEQAMYNKGNEGQSIFKQYEERFPASVVESSKK
jgi:hypothetical protein